MVQMLWTNKFKYVIMVYNFERSKDNTRKQIALRLSMNIKVTTVV